MNSYKFSTNEFLTHSIDVPQNSSGFAIYVEIIEGTEPFNKAHMEVECPKGRKFAIAADETAEGGLTFMCPYMITEALGEVYAQLVFYGADNTVMKKSNIGIEPLCRITRSINAESYILDGANDVIKDMLDACDRTNSIADKVNEMLESGAFKGEKGDSFIFDDFTEEQLKLLRGEKGDKGDKGDQGEGTAVSIGGTVVSALNFSQDPQSQIDKLDALFKSKFDELTANIEDYGKRIYPVGSIYISVNEVNPSLFIGGTWERVTGDAYLKIVAGNAGSYGGTNSQHKIPAASMPSHTHTLKELRLTGAQGLKADGAFPAATYPDGSTNGGYNMAVQFANKFALNNSGGSAAYYPYYYGVYVYKRTA